MCPSTWTSQYRSNELPFAHSHLGDILSTERVDDTSYGGLLALANEVKVQHTLHRLGLQTAGLLSVPPVFPCCWVRGSCTY